MYCTTDCDFYVDLSENLITSRGTEVCKECKKLIHVGIEHYKVREWCIADDVFMFEDEVEKGQQVVCEQCGDLAISLLEKGWCWSYGDLRDCIAELRADGMI